MTQRVDLGTITAPARPDVAIVVEDRVAKVDSNSFDLAFFPAPMGDEKLYLDRDTYLAALELSPEETPPPHLRRAEKLVEIGLLRDQFARWGQTTFTARSGTNAAILELMWDKSFTAYLWINSQSVCTVGSGRIYSEEGVREALEWLLDLRRK